MSGGWPSISRAQISPLAQGTGPNKHPLPHLPPTLYGKEGLRLDWTFDLFEEAMFARSLSLNFQANSAYLVRRAMSGTKKGIPVLKMSAPLAAVVGTDMCTRQEALKGVWAYIKANDLQNPAAKREILPDEKLKAVFGQDKATMYEVMKLISPHILK